MKTTKVLKSFHDLADSENAWLTQPERPEASPARFWNAANAPQEELHDPEELVGVRPVRGWGINE